MKLDKTLLEQIKKAYKSVKIKEDVDKEDLDVEENMSTINLKDFKDEIDYEDVPDNISQLLKFPYIPNINVIDHIKYNPENKQLMIRFKLTYKKLSELFFLRANTDRLIGKLTSSNHDRLLTFGIENMRMIIIFQLVNDLELNGDDIEPETETNEVTESVEETNIDDFSVAGTSFKQVMSSLKQSIYSVMSEVMSDNDRKLLTTIWKETQKEISEILK